MAYCLASLSIPASIRQSATLLLLRRTHLQYLIRWKDCAALRRPRSLQATACMRGDGTASTHLSATVISDTDSAVGGVHKQHLPVSHAGSKADCARPALLIALHQACSHHTTPTEGCRKCAPPSWFPGDLRVRLYLDDPACLGHHILVRSTFCHPGTP